MRNQMENQAKSGSLTGKKSAGSHWVNCNLCGQDSARFLFELGARRVVKCQNCRLVYVNPQPTGAELKKVYAAYFGTVKDPDGKTRNWVEEKDKKVREHKKEIEKLERYKKSGAILDVGSAAGFFLASLGKGWEKYGLEFDASIANYSRKTFGLDVATGELKNAKYRKEFFDIINMSHVIEHMPDPAASLKKAYYFLKQDGLLVVATPNINSLCYRIFGKDFRLLNDPGHLFFFSDKTLRNLLEKTGFEIIKIDYPYFGTPYFNARELKNLAAKSFIALALNPLLKLFGAGKRIRVVSPPFYGNTMTIYAKKRTHQAAGQINTKNSQII